MPIGHVWTARDAVPVKIWTDYVEATAEQQLVNVSKLPFVHHHVAAMPDVHAGKGATIGSVIPTYNAIVPAAVGVDIGCGMVALELNITAEDLPDDLSKVRAKIEERVPHGRTNNGGPDDKGGWRGDVPTLQEDWWKNHGLHTHEKLVEKHPHLLKNVNGVNHLGTLGTGNHFIEMCLDERDHVWIMLHSGSRGIGNRIGSYFIDRAKEEMERWHIDLPDKDLAYLPKGVPLFEDYITAMMWAQDFASENRRFMLLATLNAIRLTIGQHVGPGDERAINCHHNYVSIENHFGKNVYVTRKGAIRAREGDLGIIPGSMGDKSYIVRGKGNKESFCSCSHGAGRKMSRAEARRIFTETDLARATAGIECRKDDGVLDEIPNAYKRIDKVMEHQSDLVDVVHTLRQVVNVKG